MAKNLASLVSKENVVKAFEKILAENLSLIPSSRFDVIYKEGSLSGCKIIVDKETGVHYLLSFDGYAGGITPLLNKDGNPVIKSNNG